MVKPYSTSGGTLIPHLDKSSRSRNRVCLLTRHRAAIETPSFNGKRWPIENRCWRHPLHRIVAENDRSSGHERHEDFGRLHETRRFRQGSSRRIQSHDSVFRFPIERPVISEKATRSIAGSDEGVLSSNDGLRPARGLRLSDDIIAKKSGDSAFLCLRG